MKKIAMMLVALLTMNLSACSQNNKKEDKGMKVLVAYFSASGTTKGVAQQLVPAITDKLTNLQDYDVIYVGFPIWWNTCPTIINTFMEAYDFQGKTVIPFATSGGSSIKKACEDLKATYPDVNWKEGKLLNRSSKDDLKKWVENNK